MSDALIWFLTQIALAPVHVVRALSEPRAWLDWSNGEAIMRFAYYGASVELCFVILTAALVLTGLGLAHRPLLWGVVRGAEWFGNNVGRLFAWAGLLMVLQQTMIVFLQRIFRVSEISVGPFGNAMTQHLSWYAEELKFYNALVVGLCCAYTFIQGGHVRVDLIYAAAARRTRKLVDMIGSLVFMLPMLTLTWLYAWFFMWRHLITPQISASDTLDMLLLRARVVRWNVETTGFSTQGFNAYFLFKVIIVVFVAMMVIQALAFFWRNMLELIEGPETDARYHDADRMDDSQPGALPQAGASDRPAETV